MEVNASQWEFFHSLNVENILGPYKHVLESCAKQLVNINLFFWIVLISVAFVSFSEFVICSHFFPYLFEIFALGSNFVFISWCFP